MSMSSSVPLVSPPQAYGTGNQQQQKIDVQTLAQMDPKSLELIRDILKMQGGQAQPQPVSNPPTYGMGTPLQQSPLMSGPPVYGTIRQASPQYVPSAQPNQVIPSNVYYAPQPAYQQFQPAPQPATRIVTQFENEGSRLWNEGYKASSNSTKSEKYLAAVKQYQKAPQDNVIKQKTVTVYTNYLKVAVEMRANKRKAVDKIANACNICFGCGILAPCTIYQCYKSKNSGWIDSYSLLSHFEASIRICNELIQGLLQTNNIQLGTDKNYIPQSVRIDIAKAYSSLGDIYTISDASHKQGSLCCYNDCCFEGSQGTKDASKYDLSLAVTNYALAMQWDPSNTEYSSKHQKYDSEMKAPVVNVTYVTRR